MSAKNKSDIYSIFQREHASLAQKYYCNIEHQHYICVVLVFLDHHDFGYASQTSGSCRFYLNPKYEPFTFPMINRIELEGDLGSLIIKLFP